MSIAVKIDGVGHIDNCTGRVVPRSSKLKVAVQHPHYSALVVLPNLTSLTRARAESLGYTIVNDSGQVTAGPVNRPVYMTDAAREADAARYRAEIAALPEAQDRPFTAEKIANAYSYTSLPVARAAAVLRGLPSEIVEMRDRVEAKRAEREAAAEDPKLQRRVELRILGLRGVSDSEARRERTALQLALATARESRISVTAALARVGIAAAQFAG